MAESDLREVLMHFLSNAMIRPLPPPSDPVIVPLHDAVRSGKTEAVVALVEKGDSINATNEKGWTALHIAEFCEDTEMARCLVRLGADMTLKDTEGQDPFFHAVTGRHYEMVKCLARLGADLNTHDITATPMHRAANMNMLDMAILLAELGADLNSRECGFLKLSPLRYAIAADRIEMVELLTNLGADLNQTDLLGVTAVTAAASDGKWDMVECLSRHGADLEVNNGITALGCAVNRGLPEVVNMLIKYGVKLERTDHGFPLLFRAISNHDESTLAVLLDGGAKPDFERSRGMTPLFFSATLGNGSAAILLLNARADVNFTNDLGRTPLHGSCLYGQMDLTRLLLLAGADVNKADSFGKSPLDYLPFQDLVDYSLENRWRTCEKLVQSVPIDATPDVICPPLEKLHTIPGLGNVLAIPGGLAVRVFADVKGVIEKLPTLAGNLFIGAKPQQVGSSGEETRTGLPNEMDFVFQVDLGLDNRAVQEVGNGYAFFTYPADAERAYAFVTGSKSFHDIFGDAFMKFNTISEGSRITFMEGTHETVRDLDRKACTPMMLCWEDEGGKDKVGVSVDAVPCIHINDWPEKGARGTWLMDHATLKERGYNLIPKSPNIKSEMARGFSPEDLQRMWRISFSHLETEHMYNVIPRVKAVYVTAKCLRNPDVCQILVRDEGTKLKTAESYVVSYLLKMMFFQRVEEFQSTDQSLGEMVCQLFDDVLDGLTRNFIPLFFIPSINVLDGLKLDINKCAAVARIMTRFVKALYCRDRDARDVTGDVACTVYQSDKSLYKIYDISDIRVSREIRQLDVDTTGADVAEGGAIKNVDPSGDKEKMNSNRRFATMAGMMHEVREPGLSVSEICYGMESNVAMLTEMMKSSRVSSDHK
ncbi:uncharacterized protein LOC135492745 [Lineus longissimus]|uniref:uncharacterized protein LOC135492745 n=1 Tax=Lineus longissimus TaxID=88925 RepID=UPI00315D1FBA